MCSNDGTGASPLHWLNFKLALSLRQPCKLCSVCYTFSRGLNGQKEINKRPRVGPVGQRCGRPTKQPLQIAWETQRSTLSISSSQTELTTWDFSFIKCPTFQNYTPASRNHWHSMFIRVWRSHECLDPRSEDGLSNHFTTSIFRGPLSPELDESLFAESR